jgi:alkanesulfonate monooxygenase SsuD/methylene tetrahydromethanopterin reductase-like flavin-dependent oxidoreductase (luciferase family)
MKLSWTGALDIGLGLPTTMRGAGGDTVLAFARRAEAAGFASVGMIDRLVYPSYEPLVTLAAVAGATARVRLITMILIAPLRGAALLAKQAATLDALSGGRLSLGLGLGMRQDDYQAAEVAFERRGRRLDAQIALMKRLWSGEAADAESIGPRPARAGGPELLIGGYTPAAYRRAGRLADGFILGGAADPATAGEVIATVRAEREAAGRAGAPRIVGSLAYALGDGAHERAAGHIRHYYAFLGPRAELIAQRLPGQPAPLRAAIERMAGLGLDELVIFPAVPELEQIDRLLDVIG